jgi:hypothetical protein
VGVMRKKDVMKYLLLLLLALPFSSSADNTTFEVDLSPCVENDCMKNDLVHEFEPNSKIKVYAGYNVVHWEDRGSKLYPLFQIYNRKGKSIDIKIGLQLLDSKETVILEMMGYKTLDHTDKQEHSYETYVPLNAGSVNEDILNNTKYMRVIYKEENA